PLAATASLTWMLMAPKATLPSGFIGNIWWLAAGLLVAGSWLGLRGASRGLAKLPDRWHVRIYPLLLLLVLLAMGFGGVG
ncbi:TPA: sulfite exporter TauE/SafE family protein, partial [Klebsiella aerogenes]|nr:sulfite exporter TauE/SafE family protein [Klebsiella aerogenes]